MEQYIFRESGLRKLEFDYVPSRLPHRKNHVSKLIDFFRLTIDQPGVLSKRILITGSSGTGKTASTKKAGAALEKIANRHGLDLVYAHVNCRKTSGKFGLVQSIIRQVAPSLPLRGYSAVELLHILRSVEARLISELLNTKPVPTWELEKKKPSTVITGPIIAHPDLSAISKSQRELEWKLKSEANKLFRKKYPHRAAIYG